MSAREVAVIADSALIEALRAAKPAFAMLAHDRRKVAGLYPLFSSDSNYWLGIASQMHAQAALLIAHADALEQPQ